MEVDEAQSIDEVQRFYILLVPRPPEFASYSGQDDAVKAEDDQMTLLSAGADAVPATEPTGKDKKSFRLLIVGKKSLPDPEKGRGRSNVFWATITTVGEDLKKLEEGLGPKQYETKTRGMCTIGVSFRSISESPPRNSPSRSCAFGSTRCICHRQ